MRLSQKLIPSAIYDKLKVLAKEKEIDKMTEKQLQHEVEIEAKEKDFISMASHQLLTPLALIEGYMSMLISGHYGNLSVEVKDFLKESLEGASRMSNLVKELLTTSRLETGSIKIYRTVFDLNAVAAEVAKSFRLKITQKNLQLKILADGRLPVNADLNYIKEVLVNLLDNAVKYTDKGQITVSTNKKGSRAFVKVADTGLGIEQTRLPHIFEKFNMSENWIKKQSESHGLGLYIARLLLSQMNGTINAESKKGKGSSFTFSLPLAKNE